MVKKYILLSVIALSITSVQYHRIRSAVLTGPHPEYKINSFFSFSNGIQCFKDNQKYFWKARVFSCLNSGLFARINGIKHSNKQHIRFANVIAADQCIWLLMAFAAIIVLSKKPLLFLLGTGIALQYSWLPMSEGQINPWDMPSLFWWTLVLLINSTKYKRAILYLIPAGALYKEIIAVLSILVLFWEDYPFKRRVVLFFCLALSCVSIKIIQGFIGGCPVLGNQSFKFDYVPELQRHVCRTGETYIWQRNLHALGWWRNFNPIYFSITGLWIGLFLLPIPWMYRIIAMVYFSTVFVPGNITEARLWHELIPVFFVGYESIKRKVLV